MKDRRKSAVIFIMFYSMFMVFINCSRVYARDISGYGLYWQGYYYYGSYSGSIKNGMPDGKGTFTGVRQHENAEDNEITYIGKWKKGKFDGKGELTDILNNKVYEGKFSSGKLNGLIKEYDISDTQDKYLEKYYSNDIAYGAAKWFNSQGEAVDYELFVFGLDMEDIKKEAVSYDYYELLYHPDNYLNTPVKIECKVKDISDGFNKNVTVRDEDGNEYVLTYDMLYPEKPKNFMPFLKKGDNLFVYGFFKGLHTAEGSVSKLPWISAVSGIYVEEGDFNIQKEYSFSDFMNYPYIVQGSEIVLSGTLVGVQKVVDNTVYYLIKSDNYGDGKDNYFICSLEEKTAKTVKMPHLGNPVCLKAELNLITGFVKDEQASFYPSAKIKSMVTHYDKPGLDEMRIYKSLSW